MHLSAFRHYRRKISKDFDIVVDEVNTVPFFTPLWAHVPTVMLIHQLAREVWWYESPFPLSGIGYLAEAQYLRFYHDVPVLTISASTRDDLRRLGFRSSITIIPEGIEPITEVGASKPSEPTFLYVGRLAPSKRIEHIFNALARFRQVTGEGTLRIIGSGSQRYQQSLTRLARRLNIANDITFCGHVSSSEKHRLMAEAHAVLMTSVREGWGLVVTEANACGTPAIVYDVPGLRDSVRNELSGLVVPPRPDSLCEAMIRLTTDQGLYARLSVEGKRWSSMFSFDETARLVRLALERQLGA